MSRIDNVLRHVSRLCPGDPEDVTLGWDVILGWDVTLGWDVILGWDVTSLCSAVLPSFRQQIAKRTRLTDMQKRSSRVLVTSPKLV